MRFLIASIYTILIVGGISMIYPLVLMISGSVKGSLDQQDNDMVPGFLRDDTIFFRRYLESKYFSLGSLNESWGADFLDWKKVAMPAPVSGRLLDDFDEFRRESKLPSAWVELGHTGVPARNLRLFKREILRESAADSVRAGELFGVNYRSWAEVVPRQFGLSRAMNTPNRITDRTYRFQATCPVEEWILLDVEAYWKTSTLFARYQRRIEKYREQTGSKAKDWSGVHLRQVVPDPLNAAERADWETFVRQKAPLAFLHVDESAAPLFHDVLWIRPNRETHA